jgi:hypothetical protein
VAELESTTTPAEVTVDETAIQPESGRQAVESGNYVPKGFAPYSLSVIGVVATVLALSTDRLLIFTIVAVVGLPLGIGTLKGVRNWKFSYLTALVLLSATLAVEGLMVTHTIDLASQSHSSVSLTADPVSPTAVSSEDITISGHIVGDLEPGSTIWVAVSKSPVVDELRDAHYLQPGPCITSSDGRWTCKHVRVGPPGAWNFTVMLVDSETTNSFVEDRLAGQRKDDSHSTDADQRNFIGFPSGILFKLTITAAIA